MTVLLQIKDNGFKFNLISFKRLVSIPKRMDSTLGRLDPERTQTLVKNVNLIYDQISQTANNRKNVGYLNLS